MKKINLFLMTSATILLIACTQTKSDYDSYFSGENRSAKDIKITNLHIDSIVFDTMKKGSYMGDFSVRNNQLVFFDKYKGFGFVFDENGHLKSRIYGNGQGPLEIQGGIEGYIPFSEGDFFMTSMGGASIQIHNREMERQKIFRMNWGNLEQQRRELQRSPNSVTGKEMGAYELNYEYLTMREDKNGLIYMPLAAFTNILNPYKSNFYEKAHLLLQYDWRKNKITGFCGRYSPEYKKYNAIPQHQFLIAYDIDKKTNNMYVGQEVDSLIYVYNDKGKNIYKFGYAGKNRNTDYAELTSYDIHEFRKAYYEARPLRGYYAHIEYFEKFNLLFRSYTKGKNSIYDGLQIYKGTTLVADVNVPKGFIWVKGYIAPYFYSNAIINEDKMTLKGYRFQLPKELLK